MQGKLRALWHGMRLICPQCETGRMYDGMKRRAACDSCGVVFERSEEGDFLVTVVTVYSTTAVLIAALVFFINYTFPGMNLAWQIGICLAFGLGFSLSLYRNFKGLSIGLLYLTFGLKKPVHAQRTSSQLSTKD